MMNNSEANQADKSYQPRGWRTLVFFVVLLVISIFAGWSAFTILRNWTVSNYQRTTQSVSFSPSQGSTPQSATVQIQATSTPQLAALPEPTLTPWDGIGRVTILLLGLDYRDWEAGNEYSRSDTMILLTLDPLSRTAGILSIPRDMWVAIPGFQHGKINTAYYLGDAYKLPGGGPGLAVDTVEQFLGVPVNYYAQIDFQAFVRFIDEIGGVKINVPEAITVDLLGSGVATKKTLRPGVQVLPGEWALAYARARNTGGGDFDRAKRQQQVILGIRNRILSFDMLPLLIKNADTLFRQLSSGIRTNLTIDRAIKLALLASQVPEKGIRRGVIDEKFILFGRSPDNLAILIPLVDKIHVLRDELFSDTTALSPLTPGDTRTRMSAEAARVAIINASSTPGLADRTAEYLRSMGVNVIQTTEANQNVASSSLIDNSGKPFTSSYLMEVIGVPPLKFNYAFDPSSNADIILTLGDAWARNNSMP
jgi:polyisoprenyl-teichoic acid--peptidoglycan teichoic acid transferase